MPKEGDNRYFTPKYFYDLQNAILSLLTCFGILNCFLAHKSLKGDCVCLKWYVQKYLRDAGNRYYKGMVLEFFPRE